MEKFPVTAEASTIKGPAGNIFIDDGGEGEPAILFLHSYAGSTKDWKYQLEHVRHNHRAVAIDLRGHGKTDAPADGNYSIEGIVQDIEAAVDSIMLKNFVLVGHSMGGSAAIAFAGKYPERVLGLVVVGTPGFSKPEQAKQVLDSLESEKYEEVMNSYLDQLLTDAKDEVSTSRRNKIKELTKDQNLRIIKSVFQFDPTTSLKNYPGPKLIVSTTRENKQPNTLISQFPDVNNKTIDGTSHWSQMDKPQEFNSILDDFLKKI